MTLQIGFYATLRPLVGGKHVEVDLPEDATVQTLIDHLVNRFPELGRAILDDEGRLSRRTHVFLDGRGAIYLEQGLKTPIGRAQKIDIFPAIAGG